MSSLHAALLAGVAATALIAATGSHGKPVHSHPVTHPKSPVRTMHTTHAMRPAHTVHAVRTTTHAVHTTHTTVKSFEVRHHGGAAVISHENIPRIKAESETRIREMAHTATPLGRVTLQREAVRTIRTSRPALRTQTFVTGTIVSRSSNTVVLRTQSGSTVTVITQAVPVASTVLTTGSTVVLPVEYTNSQIMLVPAYTTTDETALANQPMLAPCAVNDNDADDAGDTSYYAPPGACSNNDGDADDGYNFSIPALPSSFAAMPQVFSSSFAPVVAAGYVVAQTGSNLVLMTPDFRPLVVNASPALSSGATNGTLSPGRYVVVYGYDVNNTLVATSLM